MTIKKLFMILMAALVLMFAGYLLRIHLTDAKELGDTAIPTAPKNTADSDPIKDYAIVELSSDEQVLGGISTTPLLAANRVDGLQAQVSVMDLNSYFSLIMQRKIAEEDLKAIKTELKVARQVLHRIEKLYNDGRNASEQNLQEAQSQLEGLQVKQTSQDVKIKALSLELSVRFGPALAILPTSKPLEFNRLEKGRAVILRASMPASAAIDFHQQYRHLHLLQPFGLKAHFLSMASNVDPLTEGFAALFYLESQLPSGLRILGTMAQDNKKAVAGVVIPANAVIWYGGQPWAYLQIDRTHYERRPISTDYLMGSGYFNPHKFKAGDVVVTRGAELLLSDEQRSPPNSVAACKDPECDD